MACLESLQVVGEVCEQAFLLVMLEGGLTPDGPVKASQPLLADVGRLRQQMLSLPFTYRVLLAGYMCQMLDALLATCAD